MEINQAVPVQDTKKISRSNAIDSMYGIVLQYFIIIANYCVCFGHAWLSRYGWFNEYNATDNFYNFELLFVKDLVTSDH